MATLIINSKGLPTAVNLGYDLSLTAVACSNYVSSPIGMFIPNSEVWVSATALYSDATETLALAGYYSDGTDWKYWDGNSFTSGSTC